MNPDLTSIDATDYSVADWRNKEIDSCHTLLTSEYDKNAADKGCGVKANDIWGWRTPRLECTNNTLKALIEVGFVYDCSLQEGRNARGGDFVWPYTLDNGSPGNSQIGSHEGLWELPCYAFIVPPNLHSITDYKRVIGLDYYCFAKSDWGGAQMSGPQFFSVLKYNLDLRLQGNRCPFLIGLHSDIYSSAINDQYPSSTLEGRQKALEDFINYALGKDEVRFVRACDVIKWMRNPVILSEY